MRREALAKLDAGLGAIGHWRDPAADPPLRLAPDASMVDALARRRGAVTVGHTRADSLIRVEASGPDPAIAQAISTALIGCAEEVVDGLSAHMRSNRPAAPSGRPTRRRRAAHQDAARLQKGLRVFLAETGAGGEALRASLAGPLSHAPEGCSQVKNPCRAAAFRAAWIETRWRRIADEGLGARDTRHASPRRPSPTCRRGWSARVEIGAKRGTPMRARSAPEAARLEARRQIGYFAMIVPPARADAPMRPRRAANTALAFVVVFGIHLFASLTVSVLREQFSA